jgi:predicted secreted protein
MTLTINDDGREVEIKQEDLLRVELEGAGATGYLWQIRDLDRSRLDLVNQSTRVLLSDGRMGGPILSVFTLKAVSKGSVVLTIDYFRPWEGRTKSEQTFSVKINIV